MSAKDFHYCLSSSRQSTQRTLNSSHRHVYRFLSRDALELNFLRRPPFSQRFFAPLLQQAGKMALNLVRTDKHPAVVAALRMAHALLDTGVF